jgi:hypothetical protein
MHSATVNDAWGVAEAQEGKPPALFQDDKSLSVRSQHVLLLNIRSGLELSSALGWISRDTDRFAGEPAACQTGMRRKRRGDKPVPAVPWG